MRVIEKFASTQRVVLRREGEGLRLEVESEQSRGRHVADLIAFLFVLVLVNWAVGCYAESEAFVPFVFNGTILFLLGLFVFAARIDRHHTVFTNEGFYPDGRLHRKASRVKGTPRWMKVPRTFPFALNWVELKYDHIYWRPCSFTDFRTRLLIAREFQSMYPAMDVRLGRAPTAEESAWVEDHRDALRSGATVCVVGCEATVTFDEDAGGDRESPGELS